MRLERQTWRSSIVAALSIIIGLGPKPFNNDGCSVLHSNIVTIVRSLFYVRIVIWNFSASSTYACILYILYCIHKYWTVSQSVSIYSCHTKLWTLVAQIEFILCLLLQRLSCRVGPCRISRICRTARAPPPRQPRLSPLTPPIGLIYSFILYFSISNRTCCTDVFLFT